MVVSGTLRRRFPLIVAVVTGLAMILVLDTEPAQSTLDPLVAELAAAQQVL